MSALDQLIRLYHWRLDEQRRLLVDVEALAARLEEERRRLDLEDNHEPTHAGASPEAACTYTSYAQQLIERRRKLAQSEAEVAAQITKARAALAEALDEVKRYEAAAANRVRQQQLQRKRRQQQVIDERAGDRVRRRGRDAR